MNYSPFLKGRSQGFAAVACLLLGQRALAQDVSPAARASAVELFDAADKLKAEGHLAEACPKYQESYRLDPQLGALLHLADCLEQDDKLASAYAAFRSARELAEMKNDERATIAQERARALEPKLSRLSIHVSSASRVPGLEVRRDGIPLEPGSWNTPLAVDRGDHVVKARAPGYKDWQTTIAVAGDGAAARVEVPPLETQPMQSAPGNEPSVGAKDRAAPTASGPRRTLAWVAGGAGVAAAGLGTVFLMQRASKLEERDGVCPTRTCPAGTGAQSQSRINALTKDARSAQTWGVVSFAASGALLATGIVLLLTTDKAPERTAKTGPFDVSLVVTQTSRGIFMQGAF